MPQGEEAMVAAGLERGAPGRRHLSSPRLRRASSTLPERHLAASCWQWPRSGARSRHSRHTPPAGRRQLAARRGRGPVGRVPKTTARQMTLCLLWSLELVLTR
eukprot:jgi/Mesen1/1427/ME001303S00476